MSVRSHAFIFHLWRAGRGVKNTRSTGMFMVALAGRVGCACGEAVPQRRPSCLPLISLRGVEDSSFPAAPLFPSDIFLAWDGGS